MLKFVAAIFFVTFFVHSVQVCSNNLEVKLLNGKRKEMAIGSTSNVLIMFTNHSDTIKEFDIKLITTDRYWRQIMDYSSNLIEKDASFTKIISIHVPKNVKAGDYSIEWGVFEKPDNQLVEKVTIPIRVLPSYQIRVDKLTSTPYLFSGDTLNAKFSIQNLSNADVSVAANIIYSAKPEIRYFNIPQDSTIITNISVTTPKDLEHYSQQRVAVIATVKDKPETLSASTLYFDIIPTDNVKFDGYNRFPVKFSTVLASSNYTQKRIYGALFDIRGSGFIDENENKKLEFHLRGPDRRGNPILGLNDEYYLVYNTPKYNISLGDNNFDLSELTESSRIGRGVQLQYNFNKISFGSFYHKPRYFPLIRQVYSFYTNYKINDKFGFSAGYLAKTDTLKNVTNLLTFSGAQRPFSWLKSEFEVAMGQHQQKTTKAYMGALNISSSFISSNVRFKYAEPDFPGFISSSMALTSGITTNLKITSLSVNYSFNSSNLALDTLYANAPYNKNLILSATFPIGMDNSLGLSANSIELEDRSVNALFHYSKYFGRISLQNKIGKVNMNIYGDLGKMENFQQVNSGDMTDFYNGYLSLKYAYKQALSVSGFINYQGGKQYMVTGFNRFYYGGSVQFNLKKTFFSFDFQNDYELKDYFRNRGLLSLQVHHEINNNHEFELSTNYNLLKNSLDMKELSVQLRYSYILNAPLSRKKNIGSLSGRVINKGVESVEGIIFNLNGKKTMTDKNGYFKYPMVKVGTYVLTMDESRFKINTIAGTPGPYRIEIQPGREVPFEIELTKAARLQGRIVIMEDEKSGSKGYYPVKEEIDKLIIEASNGTETFRILSKNDGTFRFNDLRPGSWNIKVYPNGIPSGYVLEKSQFSFVLSAAMEEHLDIVLRKKSRVIQFQSNFKPKK